MTAMETQLFETGYHRYRDDLEALRIFLNDPHWTAERIAYVHQALAELRDDLGGHYEMLDQFGFLNEVNAHAPHFHLRMRRLQWEQSSLLEALDRLIADLGQMQPTALRLAASRLIQLLDLIDRHQSKKNSLVMEAVYQDQGAMD